MRFKNKNKTYRLVLERKGFDIANGSFKKGLAMFSVLDEYEDETIGCISFGVSLLNSITSDDRSKKLINSEKSELLFLSLLPHLELNFDQLIKNYKHSYCTAYLFDSQSETGYFEKEQLYYIKIQNGFYKTVQDIIFQGEITNDKIQGKILEILYNHWEEETVTNILFEDLQIMIPVEFKALYRNLKALEEEDKIEILSSPSDNTKIISAKIKADGRKEIEGRKNTPPSAIIEYIMGNKIQASTTGDKSPIVIGQNINLAFGDIITEIENENGENKEQAINLVKDLEKEVTNDKNPDKVINILKQIKDKASWVNQKILSHPLLSQLLAMILANKIGLI